MRSLGRCSLGRLPVGRCVAGRFGARAMSTSFAELEATMWQKGAGAYASTIGSVTSQASDALLDAAGVERCEARASQASNPAVYSPLYHDLFYPISLS